MTEIEEKIGYAFRDPALLERALTTPACRMSNPTVADNQRLEFLGDAVFGLLTSRRAASPSAARISSPAPCWPRPASGSVWTGS